MKLRRLLAVLLAACMVFSFTAMAADPAGSEGAPAEESEGESAGGEGESGGSEGGSGGSTPSYIGISDGEITVTESDTAVFEGKIPDFAAAPITGVKFIGKSTGDKFLSVSSSDHVDVIGEVDGFSAFLGDVEDVYDAPNLADIFTNEGLNPNAEGYDLDYTWISQIDWDKNSATYGKYTPVTIAGQALVSKLLDGGYNVWIEGGSGDDETGNRGPTQVSVSGGAALEVVNAYIYSEGLEGLAISNMGSADKSSTMVVKDSLLVTRGYVPAYAGQSENLPNDPLLVTGADRTNLSGGESVTYYYDSVLTVDGWASLSTDSAQGAGVDLIAVNTFASALLGGYGTYADTNCRDYFYGTVLEGAEIGVIIAGTGEVSMYDGNEAMEDGVAHRVGLNKDLDPMEFASKNYNELGGSTIAGGRNALMIHLAGSASADPQGYFYAKDSALITDRDLLSDADTEYSINATWYGRELSPNIQKYIEYVSGDDIILKSTNAEVVLDNVEMTSYNNVLIHSLLNNDTSTPETPAGTNACGNRITMSNMTVSGDIIDEDYERVMTVLFDNTTINGAVVSGTCESWTSYWLNNGYAEDYTIGLASNTFGQEAALDAFVHSVVMNEDGTYTVNEYGDDQGTAVSLVNGSVWNVTAESNVTSLSVDGTSVINGIITVDGEVVEIPAEGGAWTGNIVITPAA
ncbi:MAG: hypothetical protein HUJ76_09115 [Parasporobacterium sp.]|nr:hypothetical protein [Parasporobacterium sp.]